MAIRPINLPYGTMVTYQRDSNYIIFDLDERDGYINYYNIQEFPNGKVLRHVPMYDLSIQGFAEEYFDFTIIRPRAQRIRISTLEPTFTVIEPFVFRKEYAPHFQLCYVLHGDYRTYYTWARHEWLMENEERVEDDSILLVEGMSYALS